MRTREILTKKDLDELSAAAAGLFVDIARSAIVRSSRFAVALAGGSTPRAFYSLLASDEYRAAIDWRTTSFFFGDERNVQADSPESNYRMASESLLRPLGIEPTQIYRWQTELPNVEATAADYELKLRKYFGPSGPRFDLVLLGLGDDAHTASLFPHTAAVREKKNLAVVNWVDKLDAYRFTMTFPVINSAANVLFLVAGKEKADAVANVIEGEHRPDDFPAQFVNPENGILCWLLDEGAASLLNRNKV